MQLDLSGLLVRLVHPFAANARLPDLETIGAVKPSEGQHVAR